MPVYKHGPCRSGRVDSELYLNEEVVRWKLDINVLKSALKQEGKKGYWDTIMVGKISLKSYNIGLQGEVHLTDGC